MAMLIIELREDRQVILQGNDVWELLSWSVQQWDTGEFELLGISNLCQWAPV